MFRECKTDKRRKHSHRTKGNVMTARDLRLALVSLTLLGVFGTTYILNKEDEEHNECKNKHKLVFTTRVETSRNKQSAPPVPTKVV